MNILTKIKKELEARQFEEPYVAGINYSLGVIERIEKENAPDDRFAQFYAKYPRKIARKNAEKAWAKLKVDDALFERIMHALEKMLPKWVMTDKQYIPHPATWLNGERWEDEVEGTTTTKSESKFGHLGESI